MKTIICHPDNVEILQAFVADYPMPIAPMPLRTDLNCPKTKEAWQPPDERFFEYEESDYDWLRYFGYGGMHDTGEPVFFVFDDDLSMMSGTFRLQRDAPPMRLFTPIWKTEAVFGRGA